MSNEIQVANWACSTNVPIRNPSMVVKRYSENSIYTCDCVTDFLPFAILLSSPYDPLIDWIKNEFNHLCNGKIFFKHVQGFETEKREEDRAHDENKRTPLASIPVQVTPFIPKNAAIQEGNVDHLASSDSGE